MGLETIINGSFDNDPSAEKVRDAFGKAIRMFAEIYGKIPLDLAGENGKVMVVKATEDGFELINISGGGDMLSTNNLSEIASKSQARLNLGLGSAATQDTSDFATEAQGTKADNALQSLGAGTGITIDFTDPNNPLINNSETNSYLNGLSFDPSTGVVTASILGGGTVTLDLSAYTVLKIGGFQAKKGAGNTNLSAVEIGDYLKGWEGDRYVAFRVDGLPFTTESNRKYAINNQIFD